MTPLDLSEAAWQTQVLELASLYRWMMHYDQPCEADGTPVTSIQGDRGFPRLVLARSGRLLFVELKTNQATLTTDQMAWRDRLSVVPGVEWRCWRPRDWDEVKATLTPAPWSNLRLTEDIGTGGRT